MYGSIHFSILMLHILEVWVSLRLWSHGCTTAYSRARAAFAHTGMNRCSVHPHAGTSIHVNWDTAIDTVGGSQQLCGCMAPHAGCQTDMNGTVCTGMHRYAVIHQCEHGLRQCPKSNKSIRPKLTRMGFLHFFKDICNCPYRQWKKMRHYQQPVANIYNHLLVHCNINIIWASGVQSSSFDIKHLH